MVEGLVVVILMLDMACANGTRELIWKNVNLKGR